MTTTSYGTWTTLIDRDAANFKASVDMNLGAYAEDYDVEGIVEGYAQAIADALPDGVSFVGNEFIGPAYQADCDWDGYPRTEDGALDIAAIVESVDFWETAGRLNWGGLVETLAATEQAARAVAEAIRAELRTAVLAAIDGGMSEVRAAELAGVARMTVRAWQGK